MIEEFKKAYNSLKGTDARAIILSGNGKHFTSGIDCKESRIYV